MLFLHIIKKENNKEKSNKGENSNEKDKKQEKIKLDKPTNFIKGKTRIFPTEVREMLTNISDDELRKIISDKIGQKRVDEPENN